MCTGLAGCRPYLRRTLQLYSQARWQGACQAAARSCSASPRPQRPNTQDQPGGVTVCATVTVQHQARKEGISQSWQLPGCPAPAGRARRHSAFP